MRNWIIGILLVLVGAAAFYYFSIYRSDEPVEVLAPQVSPPPAVTKVEPAEAETEIAAPVPEAGFEPVSPPPVDQIPIPMLEDSDPVVLETLGELIGQPEVARYLVNENVVSRIVATVEMMGSRQIPGVVQVVQGPATDFEAIVNEQPESVIRNEEGDEIPQFVIDTANYQRYTPYVELLEASDAAELVGQYRTHYSLFQEAYRQMGYPDGDFNDRLVEIIDELLATPETGDPVNLVKPEAFYLFSDPGLEALSAGQKIIVRMGSANAARTKAKLSEIRGLLKN